MQSRAAALSASRSLVLLVACVCAASPAAGVEETIVDAQTPGVRWTAPIGHRRGMIGVGPKHVVVGTNEVEYNAEGTTNFGGTGGSVVGFDRASGRRLWQRKHSFRFPQRRENAGVASTPTIDGERVYYLSNAGEFVCLNVADGALVWSIDMPAELKICFASDWALFNPFCQPLVHGDYVYCVTGNGCTHAWSSMSEHLKSDEAVPRPDAPHFLCVHKATGKIAWSSAAPGKKAVYSWSSPVLCRVGDREAIAFPGGDGTLYFFEPVKGALLYSHEFNRPGVKEWGRGGHGGERTFFTAAPVVVGDMLYAGTAQDTYDYPKDAPLLALDLKRMFEREPKVERWRVDSEKYGWTRIAPAIGPELVFVVDDEPIDIVALDKSTGAIRARREGSTNTTTSPFGSLHVIGDRLYVTLGMAIDVYTADDRLEHLKSMTFLKDPDEGYGEIQGPMVVDGGEVFVAQQSHVFCLSLNAIVGPATAKKK